MEYDCKEDVIHVLLFGGIIKNHSANLLLLTFENDIPWIIFAYVLPDAKLQEAEQGIMRSVFRLVNFLPLKLIFTFSWQQNSFLFISAGCFHS